MKKDLSIYNKTSINSPFRYAGGKFYARKLIGSYIPEHDYFVEPFVGGGSVFFYKWDIITVMKMKSICGHSNSEGKKTPPVELSQ